MVLSLWCDYLSSHTVLLPFVQRTLEAMKKARVKDCFPGSFNEVEFLGSKELASS